MKRAAVSIIISFAVILGCMGLYFVFCNGTVEIFAEIPPGARIKDISFSSEGIAELNSYDILDESTARLVFQKVAPGETEAVLAWDGADEAAGYSSEIIYPLKVSSLGIVTEEITANFTGWKETTFATAVFLIAVAVILFAAFCRALKNDMYAYATVRYLGFAFFFLLLGIMRMKYLADVLMENGNGTVWGLLVGMSVSAQRFMIYTSPVVFVFAAALTISNLYLIRHEGLYPSNLFALTFAVLMAGGAGGGIILAYSRKIFILRNLISSVYAGLFCYFECLFFATVVCGVIASRHIPAYDKDFVIVLGCRIRDDGTLYPIIKSRVDKAIQFVHDQLQKTGKQAILVPSGGKGTDEKLAEAQAMKNYMLENGISADCIMAEDKSATTSENMRFSKEKIDSVFKNARIAFSTSDFHVFRSGILAKNEGIKLEGMGSPTKWYFWPNAFVREFVALLADNRITQVITVAIISLMSAMLTLIL